MNPTPLETFHRLDDLQHLDAATALVEQWLLDAPDSALAWAAQARNSYRQGLIEQARAAAEKPLALQPACLDAGAA